MCGRIGVDGGRGRVQFNVTNQKVVQAGADGYTSDLREVRGIK